MYLLNAVMTDTFLPDLGEKLTLIGCMGFFLWYFMKELKQVREKYDALFERIIEQEKKYLETLNNVSDSNDRLANAVEALKEQLKK